MELDRLKDVVRELDVLVRRLVSELESLAPTPEVPVAPAAPAPAPEAPPAPAAPAEEPAPAAPPVDNPPQPATDAPAADNVVK